MSNDSAREQSPQPPRFEDALKRLEEIVHLLEEGEIGLDEALARYEEGVKLLRHAHDLLQRAERQIEILSGVDAQGNPVCEPFDHEATAERHDEIRPSGRRGAASERKSSGGRSKRPGGHSDMDAPGGLF